MEGDRARRRIDRVTSAGYVDSLAERTTDEVRRMRDDCRAEEAGLSFARRVAQGQLDIARAERRRREAGGEEGLVGALSEILADQQPAPGSRQVRMAPVQAPDEQRYGQRAHDMPVDDPALGRVPELSDAELAQLVDRLQRAETHVSELRQKVLAHLDALQAELVSRYRSGTVDVDAVVAGRLHGQAPPSRRGGPEPA